MKWLSRLWQTSPAARTASGSGQRFTVRLIQPRGWRRKRALLALARGIRRITDALDRYLAAKEGARREGSAR